MRNLAGTPAGGQYQQHQEYKYPWQDPMTDLLLMHLLVDPEKRKKLGDGVHEPVNMADWEFISNVAQNLSKQVILPKLISLFTYPGMDKMQEKTSMNEAEEMSPEIAWEVIYRDARACMEKPNVCFDRAHVAHILAIHLQEPLSHALRRRNPELKDAVVRIAPIWAEIYNELDTMRFASVGDRLLYLLGAWDEMIDATTDKNKLLPKSDGTIMVWDDTTKKLRKSERMAFRNKADKYCMPYHQRLPKNAGRADEPLNGCLFFSEQFRVFFPITFPEYAKKRRDDSASLEFLD